MTQHRNAGGNTLLNSLRLFLKITIPLAVLALGAGIVHYMMATAPQPKKSNRQRQARLVEVVHAEQADTVARVVARGAVMPAREVTLNPQVSGEIIEISHHLQPGGTFKSGELIVAIDPREYELTVKERATDVVRMEAKRTMEQANQVVARKEYETLGETFSDEEKSLVLRQPQLASADAELQASRAMLEVAQLALERTQVYAPFDAQVIEKHVDLGARVTTQTPIVRIIGTDTYWVELAVPQGDIAWIRVPASRDDEGSRVVLRQRKVWGSDVTREGRVIRLLPGLADEGRMARVLVAVEDPLALEPDNAGLPKLLCGQYLEAEIEGETLERAVAVDRRLLRDGDSVWLMNAEDKLEIRPLDIAYRGIERVLVRRGLEHGDRIVATNIASVAEGMELRISSPATDEATAEPMSAGNAS